MKFFVVCIFAIIAYVSAASDPKSNETTDVSKKYIQEHVANFTNGDDGPANSVNRDDRVHHKLGNKDDNADESILVGLTDDFKKIAAAANSGTVHKLGGWVTFAAGGVAVFVTRIAYRF